MTTTASATADPSALHQIATGYWSSAVLLAANELGLFGALADGAETAAEVARILHTHPRTTAILLDACAALHLLSKEAERYRLTATAAFLVPGCPGYLGRALLWLQGQYAAWGRLAEAVRSGDPITRPELHLGGDQSQTRRFVMAMHERALGVARGVVPFLDLSGCATLLDVGGGPGTYAAMLAQRHPGLQITLLDLPAVCAVAQELLAENMLETPIVFKPGDATQAEYGHDAYDAVLFSGVLHQMGPATGRRMLAAAHRALRPGGRLLICDMMLERTKTQPAFSALFSLQMALTSRQGAVFSTAECSAWLQEAGFGGISILPLPPPLPYTLIRADRSSS